MASESPSSAAPPKRHRFLRVVYLGFVVLFVLATVARFIPPTTLWWLQLLASVWWLLAVLHIPFALINWRIARLHGRRWIAFHAGLLLATLLFAVPWKHIPNRADADGTGLRVVTSNAKRSSAAIDTLLPAYVAERQPHLLAAQEARVKMLRPPADTILSAERHLLGLILAGFEVREPISLHQHRGYVQNPVFSRLPWAAFELYKSTEPIYPHAPSFWSRAEVLWQGQRIALYNVHLRSFARPRQMDKRDPAVWWALLGTLKIDYIERAAEVRVLKEVLAKEALPFIVCGDFNTTPYGWTFRHLADGLQDTAWANLSWAATFPDGIPLARIDYILASPHWTVVSASVGPSVGSDHLPVMATLVLNEAAAAAAVP